MREIVRKFRVLIYRNNNFIADLGVEANSFQEAIDLVREEFELTNDYQLRLTDGYHEIETKAAAAL